MTLNPKQAAFVAEYLIDLNAKQAAIRAGYSARTAAAQASRLMTMPEITDAITQAKAQRSERLEITADRVLSELAALAFFDPGALGSSGVKGPGDITKLPEALRRAIVGWSWDRNGNFTLKLSDKLGALTLLGRHLAMFTDRTASELTGKNGGPIRAEISHLTDDEIDARIAELLAETGAGGAS